MVIIVLGLIPFFFGWCRLTVCGAGNVSVVDLPTLQFLCGKHVCALLLSFLDVYSLTSIDFTNLYLFSELFNGAGDNNH